MNSILIWLVTAVLGFGSFSQSATSAESAVPAPESTQATAEPSRAIGQRFAEREMLPPCGMVNVSRRSSGTPGATLTPPRRAWRCLDDAIGVRGAELVTLDERRNRPTVYTFYRGTHDGRLEIWVQRTRSASGRLASRWSYEECTPSDDLLRQPCAS